MTRPARSHTSPRAPQVKRKLGDLKESLSGFYFFGFFESATGERPPWYLRPSLTFPLIFIGVGLSFYGLVEINGILLRGDSSPIPGQDGFSL